MTTPTPRTDRPARRPDTRSRHLSAIDTHPDTTSTPTPTPTTPTTGDWLWSPADVAAYLGVPVATLYQWRTRHYGPPARRIGKHLRYLPADVRAWVEAIPTESA